MADALRQQMADDIASLVKKQTFAGSGVWRQSGNATLRIENQTDSIVEALQRIPSRETQEEEERESDRQHEELIDAIKGISVGITGTSAPEKKGGLLGAVGAGMAMGTASIAKSTGSLLSKLNPFKKGGTIAKILGGLVTGAAGIATLLPKGLIGAIKFFFKGLKFLGFGAAGLAIAGFLLLPEDTQKSMINGFFNVVDKVGNFFKTITKQFSTEFMKTFEEVGGNEELDRLGNAFNNFTDVLGVQATGLINYVKNLKVSFDGVDYTGEDLVKFFAQISAKTSKNLIKFAAATLEYLADPELAIKDLKEVVSKSLDEFGFQFSEIFSKAGLIRMLESYGLSFLVSDNFREKAAIQQRERFEATGREMPENISVAKSMEASDFGTFSPAGIGSGLLSIYDFVLVKPLRDTLNALQRTAKERQSELKVLREGDTRKSPLEIFINKIFGDDANLHEGGFINKGGFANVAAGEMMMDNFAAEQALKAANIIQSYLPQSGAVINDLQMNRTMGETMGSAAPVVIDNSQQPTIINQTNVAAPQTRGPALVGEGRDKVNLNR